MLSYILPCLSLLSLCTISTATQAACNGRPELCDRQYSNITHVGAHDSAFIGTLPQDNQDVDITAQLDAGIRFLQVQSHMNSGSLHLCHTSCSELDAGSLSDYLSTIKAWLDKNPSEVVTLLFVNGDNANISEFDSAYVGSGLKKYAYTPPSSPLALNAWPTLDQLIGNNTRLVTFVDAGADTATAPYILDEWTYFFETPYDTTDPAFAQCQLDRPPNSKPDGKMYIMNHFLDKNVFGILMPDNEADPTTNAATGKGSIGAQASLCEGLYGRNPWGVLVDYFDKGDGFTAQNALNGLSGNSGSSGSYSTSSSSSTASATSSTSSAPSASASGSLLQDVEGLL